MQSSIVLLYHTKGQKANEKTDFLPAEGERATLPKAADGGFSMDRKNDGKGNSSVAARRATTENAPCPVFCETRKDAPGVLAGPPNWAGSEFEFAQLVEGERPLPEAETQLCVL